MSTHGPVISPRGSTSVEGRTRPHERLFPVIFGCFLGLTLLKFGNPPILEKFVTPPKTALQVLLWSPWPISWAYGLLSLLVLYGLFAGKWRPRPPKWIFFLPLPWLLWQVAATFQSIEPQLSYPTLAHFFACSACFYLGYCCLSRSDSFKGIWIGLIAGFLIVLAVGFDQHFGGLQRTRDYFYSVLLPQMKEVPPDYLKKLTSNRIFSTLFYPNTLAGAILLFTPPILSVIAGAWRRFTVGARLFLLISLGLAAGACLVWSSSKGGWLLLLALMFLALLRVSFSRQLKLLLVAGIILTGLATFAWRYADFFKRGATSVVARFDYWDAALQTAGKNPVFGTGPGTFAKPYQDLKRPESEMARLVHNDYLEQASDSGWLGFLTYSGFVVVALVFSYPRPPTRGGGKDISAPQAVGSSAGIADVQAANWHQFAIWLGVLGWALQGLMEFGLYIPALSWPAFAFLGALLGQPRPTQECRHNIEHGQTKGSYLTSARE